MASLSATHNLRLASCLVFLLLCSIIHAQSHHPDSVQIYNLIERAKLDVQTGQLEALSSRTDSLQTLANTMDETKWKLIILCALTELHVANGELEKAERTSDQAFEQLHADRIGIPDTIADLVYFLRAEILSENGEWDEFEKYIDSSFQILHNFDIPDPVRESRNAIRMSYLTYSQGNLGKTIEWTKLGIDQMASVRNLSKSDSTQIASLYNNYAFLNDSWGNFDDVIPNYSYALQYDPKLVSAYINLAILLRTTQPERSIELSKQVLQYIPFNSYHNRCNAYSIIITGSLVLAEALEDTTRYNTALQYHDSILHMQQYAKPRDYPFTANTHGLFADYFSRRAKKRDLDKAQFHLAKNSELLEGFSSKTNTRNLVRISLSHKDRLARLASLQGDFKSADKALKEVNKGYRGDDYIRDDEFVISSDFLLNNSSALHYPLTYISNLIGWSREMEDPTVKLSQADHIYQIVDSTFDQLLYKNELDIEDLEINRLHSRGTAIAINMYEATGDAQYLEEAYNRIEKLFSLDLFANLVRSRLRNSTDSESAIYRQKLFLLEEIDLLTRKKEDETFDQGRLDSLNKLYLQVVENLGTSYKSKENENLISLPELQKQINPNQALLHFVHDKMGSSLYGLCITKDQILPIHKPIENLEYLIHEANAALSDPNSTNYKALLSNLYDVFIKDIAEVISDKDLAISAMGKLELVPYDLLLDESESYLCFDHSIRHVYSAGWNQHAPNSDLSGIYGYTSSPKNIDPTVERGDGILRNLNAAREEIAFLAKEFKARVFIDEKSTKETFIKTASKAGIVHLALHGITNPLEPIKSRLIFNLNGNEEEDLYYHEIDDLEINAQLVTLSACNSGRGNLRGAGSVASLARAFHYAGCPNVVQTLWSVNDETSLHLMKNFYQNLKDGKAVANALSIAKQDFYNSVPQKWKHPYYWGGYVYNGQDTQIEIKERSNNMLYIGGVFLLTVFLMLIFRLKSV